MNPNGNFVNYLDYATVEEADNCLELQAIELQCRIMADVLGDTTRMLYVPCMKMMTCKACVSKYTYVTEITGILSRLLPPRVRC